MQDQIPPPGDEGNSTISATQQVYQKLREMIVTGKIAPDEKLKVDRLKTMFNTGASPIREALSLLTSDQLVERLDQRGFRAAHAGAEQFHEVLKLRCALEDIALRDSIRDGDKDWEEALVLAHHRLTRAPREDVESFEARHKEFHMSLLTACGSPILLKFCGQLYDLNIRYRYMAGQSGTYGKRDVASEHLQILNAAIDRDADSASEALIRHYRLTGEFLADRIGLDASD